MSTFVSVDEPTIDLAERATERTLLQFRNSSVFLDVLQAFIQEVRFLQNAIIGVINQRGIADAFGENLNAIGRIVGQGRTIFNYSQIAWFTPDTSLLGCDQAPAWVEGAYTAGQYIADDVWYRELISAKIFRNFSRYGSVPEILQVIKQALNFDVSFYRTGPMEAQLIVNQHTPQWIINFILGMVNDTHIEGVPFSPFPATLHVFDILYAPTNSFTPDINDGCQADAGVLAVAPAYQ